MSTVTKENKEETIKNMAKNVETTQIRPYARQRHSILEKIAFWTSLVGFLGGLGGTIALTFSSGAPSQDIVIPTTVQEASRLLAGFPQAWA